MITKLNFNVLLSFKFLVCSHMIEQEACDDFETSIEQFLIGVLLRLPRLRSLDLRAVRIHLKLKGNELP